MIDLLRGSEHVLGYHVRAWTGVATDEGVGLISTVEVSDERGVPVCRFEEFLDASLQRTSDAWPLDNEAASRLLQERAMERARGAVLGGGLREVHGHRFDIPTA
jgi:hypothetical protein